MGSGAKIEPVSLNNLFFNNVIMGDDEFDTVMAMKAYGGSFVKSLGECYTFADRENRKRIRETFKDYWEEYHEKAVS